MPGDQDVYLFREGTHGRLYSMLGCQLGHGAATFRVWAPNAARVAVIGEWNGWDAGAHPLVPRRDASGMWEGTVAGVARGDAYKYPHRHGAGRAKWRRPTRSHCSPRRRRRRRRAPGRSTTIGTTTRG